MNENGDTASNDAANESSYDASQNPNDLANEMSAEEEASFVDSVLGINNKTQDNTSDEEDDTTDEEDTDSTATDNTRQNTDEDTSSDDNTNDEDTKSDEEETNEDESSDKTTSELDENGVKIDDLWVEVEDSEGNKVKLSFDPTNPAGFLPDDFTFKNDKQLFEILDAKREMESLYKERSTEFETKQEQQTEAAKLQEIQSGWDQEIADLIEGGVLDAPKAKPGDKNFLEDPAVQKIDAVFKFMTEENHKRVESGKQPIRSFATAQQLLATKEAKAAEEIKRKEENQMAKKRGGLVGGSSSSSVSDTGYVYKSGSSNNIWNVPTDDL